MLRRRATHHRKQARGGGVHEQPGARGLVPAARCAVQLDVQRDVRPSAQRPQTDPVDEAQRGGGAQVRPPARWREAEGGGHPRWHSRREVQPGEGRDLRVPMRKVAIAEAPRLRHVEHLIHVRLGHDRRAQDPHRRLDRRRHRRRRGGRATLPHRTPLSAQLSLPFARPRRDPSARGKSWGEGNRARAPHQGERDAALASVRGRVARLLQGAASFEAARTERPAYTGRGPANLAPAISDRAPDGVVTDAPHRPRSRLPWSRTCSASSSATTSSSTLSSSFCFSRATFGW